MKIKLILCLFSFIFIVSISKAYSASAEVSGKILDNFNNPISNAVIVFVTNEGKTVAAVTANISGVYDAMIPNGTYTISVSGPRGSNLKQITETNQVISESSVRNFTLIAPSSETAVKPFITPSLIFYALGAIGAILVVIAGYILLRMTR